LPITTVVFDIGGVLEHVDEQTWHVQWMNRWEGRAGVPGGHLAEALLRDDDLSTRVTTGALSEAELQQIYVDTLGLSDSDADHMMAEMWDAYCGELDTELADFVASLRPERRTALLSNSADGARREEQRRYGFEQLVDEIIYSHEVGLAKPDPRIYRLAEERLGAAADEIVYVDDVRKHVDAATARGWHAILHRDTAETIRAVRPALSL
jgi:glucose-1-phosphatase